MQSLPRSTVGAGSGSPPPSRRAAAARVAAYEDRRDKTLAAWERRRAEGRAGWTPEQRAHFGDTMARKFPKSSRGMERRYTEEVAELRAVVDRLTARIVALEARPQQVQIVEWRPNHRRIVEGGRHVRDQRRAMGIA